MIIPVVREVTVDIHTRAGATTIAMTIFAPKTILANEKKHIGLTHKYLRICNKFKYLATHIREGVLITIRIDQWHQINFNILQHPLECA